MGKTGEINCISTCKALCAIYYYLFYHILFSVFVLLAWCVTSFSFFFGSFFNLHCFPLEFACVINYLIYFMPFSDYWRIITAKKLGYFHNILRLVPTFATFFFYRKKPNCSDFSSFFVEPHTIMIKTLFQFNENVAI